MTAGGGKLAFALKAPSWSFGRCGTDRRSRLFFCENKVGDKFEFYRFANSYRMAVRFTGILSLEPGLLRKGRNGNPRGIAQLENPVAKILRRQFPQNPFKFQKNGGSVGLFEGNDDDAVVLGKQLGNRVKEIAVRCQQNGPLLLRQFKDGMIARSLLGQFEHPPRRVASLLQEICSRFGEIFVEEKIHAAA